MTTEAVPSRPPSQTVSAVLSLVALVLGVIAGFLVWFNIAGSTFALVPDSYHVVFVYIGQGSAAISGTGVLGTTLYNAGISNPIVVVAFAIVLFFWPAMLVSGALNLILRSYGFYPFVWGLIAFIFAYIMMNEAGASLGIGAYLALVAAILFLVASITVRRSPAKSAPAPPQPVA